MANENEEMIKRAVISGAAHALKYKNRNPNKSEQEILQEIVRELGNIIKEIDRE